MSALPTRLCRYTRGAGLVIPTSPPPPLTPKPPPRTQIGRAVHSSADAIHAYATEVRPHLAADVPPDLLALIRYLDDDLGHWLLWLPFFPLLALLTVARARTAPAAAPSGPRAAVAAAAAGALMGATHAVAVIESGHWWLGVYGAAALLLGAAAAADAAAGGGPPAPAARRRGDGGGAAAAAAAAEVVAAARARRAAAATAQPLLVFRCWPGPASFSAPP
jgi:hypothetical protein